MAQKKYRIGIDLGGTNIKVGVIGADDKLVATKSGETDPFRRPWQEVVADMARLVREMLAEAGIFEVTARDWRRCWRLAQTCWPAKPCPVLLKQRPWRSSWTNSRMLAPG